MLLFLPEGTCSPFTLRGVRTTRGIMTAFFLCLPDCSNTTVDTEHTVLQSVCSAALFPFPLQVMSKHMAWQGDMTNDWNLSEVIQFTSNSKTNSVLNDTVDLLSISIVNMVLTCLERLSLVWVCGVCWACCVSVRPCCPAALLRRVWGWLLGACTSVEQEALDELSSTEAAGQRKINLQLHSVTHIYQQHRSSLNIYKMVVQWSHLMQFS